MTLPLIRNQYTTDCSSMVAAEEVEGHDHQQVTDHQVVTHLEKKRKPTELVEGKCKNENKFDDGMSHNGGQKKKKKKQQQQLELAERKNKKKAPEKPPCTSGYDHVRARRGEATNSHSLAERLRREKISERMSLLQSLVPGCDKINGKTRVLDEIINYVQSLQNQVEFLVMKLASAYPMLNDLNNNNPALENFCNLETLLPSGPESDSIQAKTAISETMASNSNSFFHQPNDVSIFFSEYSDTKACSTSIGDPWFECEINPTSLDDNLTHHFRDQLEYMDDQTEKLANDCAFNNSCFF